MAVHRGVARDRDRNCEHDGMRQITMNSQFLPLKVRLRPRAGGSPKTAATVPDVSRGSQPRKPRDGAPQEPRPPGFAELDPNTSFRPPEAPPANSSSGAQALPDSTEKTVHKPENVRPPPYLPMKRLWADQRY